MQETNPPFHVVGVGASAGGLEALERLFESMPSTTGLAFVVVQHLSPDFRSLTDELLARRTPIPIRRVEDGMEVHPDAIYLIPPRKDMILSSGRLLLTDKDPSLAVALPIDHFFRSLAQDLGDRAVGIVLSGTGSDGSRGVREIHAAGGLVVAQLPESAKFDGMPRSALETGAVHLVLSPEEMPGALMRHAKHPLAAPAPEPPADAPPAGLGAILRLLRDLHNIDFSHYKPDTVYRRIERRLLMHQTGMEDYARKLAADPVELNQVYKDLLIGVTRFFRDEEAFARLVEHLGPALDRVGHDEEFRAWVAGCATGEEAYSLAIVVRECLDRLGREVPVKIFATDAHRASLDVAGLGIYPAANLIDLGPGRVDRFFAPRADGLQVSPELRKMVVFAPHNLLKDAPFTKLDLITCRNLLIYFQPAAQKRVLSLFHFGLRPGGVLFLGPSESPGELNDEFDVCEPRWKVYRKRRDVRLTHDVRLPTGLPLARPRLVGPPAPAEPPLAGLYDRLLDDFLPPSLLVNERREVVQVFAGASRFLKMREGRFSNDVLDMVAPEVRVALAGALPRVLKEVRPVVYKGLRVPLADGEATVNLTVKPVSGTRTPTHLLVTMEEVATPARADSVRESDLGQASREQIVSLEADLRFTKENLQAMIEELETSNEELQATNEELVASNEELQSTNEELHSVNEELYTVNAEYQHKIAELTELTADMDNLLGSTQVHTIFLDRDLCIRKFTPMIAETFNLLPQDVGRRIDHFTYSIDRPALLDELREVLASGKPSEQQVRDRRDRCYLMRLLPYRSGQAVKGVVLTLIDVTAMKHAESQVQEKDQQLRGILSNSPSWVFIRDLQGRYVVADEAFSRAMGQDPVGKTPRDLFPADVAELILDRDARVVAEGTADQAEVVLPLDDGPHVFLAVTFPLRDEAGHVTGVGGIKTDVTRLKSAERQATEAVVQRDRFLAVLSHELRNPLAAILNALMVLRRGKGDPGHWLGVIERRTRHVSRLLDDLLDVARVAHEKITIRRAVFDLAAAMSEASEEVQPWFAERQVRLIEERPEGAVLVEGDPDRLQQVQVNLLTNAAKYTPAGGRVWYRLSREGDEAVVRVRDTGVGMSARTMERAFDAFVQADETLARSGGGIGVGLTLARSLVAMHGGTVAAHSDGPGKGSEFVVRLPLARAAVPVPEPAPEASPDRPSLLLVEDDVDIRESLAAVLRLDGYPVRAVADGPAALLALAEAMPEVMLVDVGLPGMSGYDLARKVRQAGGAVPYLVALTGYGQQSDRAAAFEAGFDQHLTKPVQFDELGRALSGRR